MAEKFDWPGVDKPDCGSGIAFAQYKNIKTYAAVALEVEVTEAAHVCLYRAVVAEFVAGNRGLGYLIIFSNDELNAPLTFASITVLSAMSLGLFGIIVGLEKKLMPWRRGIETTEM